MKNVEIDTDIYEILKAEAEPFVDTPSTVLRRLLENMEGAPEVSRPARPGGGRASPGSILPEGAYEVPILEELIARGGSGHATEITDAVGARLDEYLTDKDREKLDSGEIRWRNRVHFTRLTLKNLGLIAKDSPRGVWRITEAGREYAEAGGETR